MRTWRARWGLSLSAQSGGGIMPVSSTWQLRRTTHISKAQQQRPFVTGCLSVQRHRDDDNDDVGSNADQALSKHKVLLLNKGPRIGKRQGSITKHCVARSFFAPARAAKGGGPRFFVFFFFLAQSHCPVAAKGSTPDIKQRGGARDGAFAKAHRTAHRSSLSGTLPWVQGKLPRGQEVQVPQWQHYFFFSPVHSGCFLRERPIFTLPHSHSLAQFQTNPKSLQSARHAAWIHTKPDTGGCVHNVPSLRDKVITHTHTQGLGMTPLEVALRISTPRY